MLEARFRPVVSRQRRNYLLSSPLPSRSPSTHLLFCRGARPHIREMWKRQDRIQHCYLGTVVRLARYRPQAAPDLDRKPLGAHPF